MSRSARLVCAGLLVVAAGCTRGPTYVPVSGTVRLDGKPLANVQVSFVLAPEAGFADATGIATTNAVGEYTLGSLAGRAAVAAGPYRVMIAEPDPTPLGGLMPPAPPPDGDPRKLPRNPDPPADPPGPPPKPPRFPAVYGDYTNTPLRLDVTPATTRYDLDLSSKP